jgi:hypothetical protein
MIFDSWQYLKRLMDFKKKRTFDGLIHRNVRKAMNGQAQPGHWNWLRYPNLRWYSSSVNSRPINCDPHQLAGKCCCLPPILPFPSPPSSSPISFTPFEFFFYFSLFKIIIREMNPTKSFFQIWPFLVTQIHMSWLMKELCQSNWRD